MNNKSGLNKLLPIYLLTALGVIALGVAFYFLYLQQKHQKYSIKVGAGKKNSESYEFINGIKTVAEKLYPDRIEIHIIETGGSKENLHLLERGKIDFATIQSDITPSEDLRLISYLYPDFYQLLVAKESDIMSVADLDKKVVNITGKTSGQYYSLLELLKHYQVNPDSCHFKVTSDFRIIAQGLKNGKMDAVFRVRSPLYPEIDSIIALNNNIRFIEIDQGEALSYKIPSTYSAFIPKGTYEVQPTIPQKDIESLANNRLFVCDKENDEEVVELMTELMFENKYLLSLSTPLAGFIRNPINNEGTLVPIHEGTKMFFSREKPPWYVRNADFLSFVISLFASLITASFGLRKFWDLRRKNQADNAMRKVLTVIEKIKNEDSESELKNLKNQLYEVLNEVVTDLDVDKINAEGFNMFTFLYNLAKAEINTKLK